MGSFSSIRGPCKIYDPQVVKQITQKFSVRLCGTGANETDHVRLNLTCMNQLDTALGKMLRVKAHVFRAFFIQIEHNVLKISDKIFHFREFKK